MRILRSCIARTRKTLLWNRALDAYHAGKTTESIALVHRMRDIGPLQHYHYAFLGTAYILARDTLKAREYLEAAKARTDDEEDPSSRYVNTYAKIYLKMMDTQEPVSEAVRTAMAIRCSSSLKRWLPLEQTSKQ